MSHHSSIALVSCCGPKLAQKAPARDLYISPLFKLARAWAEANADRWVILSALYGVVQPDEVIYPYDKRMDTRMSQRQRWAASARGSLLDLAREPTEFIFLAGSDYSVNVTTTMQMSKMTETGHKASYPLDGLQIGQRLQWFKQQLEAA